MTAEWGRCSRARRRSGTGGGAASRIPAQELGTLTGVYDDLTRLRCSGGFSFIDLCNRRWPGRELPVVDVVLLPRSHDEVRAILDLAAASNGRWCRSAAGPVWSTAWT